MGSTCAPSVSRLLAARNAVVQIALTLALFLAWFQVGYAAELIPVHGYVLSAAENGHVVMRFDRVVDMLRAGVYDVDARQGSAKLPPPGTQVDAVVTRDGDALALSGSPAAAPRHIAGMPNSVVKHFVDVDDAAPRTPTVRPLTGRAIQERQRLVHQPFRAHFDTVRGTVGNWRPRRALPAPTSRRLRGPLLRRRITLRSATRIS